ncbi:15-anhydro-D-fructose reductase protein [Marine Group I thaumarchaeote SCGC AAA799-D07]|nr:15-anhydro-D-fructose reductase protein [Marine Group I thaumarchaeote SCGC AAA799-D07]
MLILVKCLKILVVGYGSIGKRHVNNILSNTKSEIIICTKQENLALLDRKRVKVFGSLSKCLLEKPDIGFITNETVYHIPTAIKLAKEGLDLFIEKPLSNSMKDVVTLKNIVKRKKLIVQLGYNLRFHECVNKIRKLVKQKKIGRIISIQAENGSYLPDWHPYEDYKKGYAGKKKLGGGIILTQIHDVDYLYWIFGNPKSIFSISGKFSDLDISAEDYSASIIQFKNKITAELHLDFFQGPEYRKCKIKGTKGIIFWDSINNEVELYNNRKKKWISILKLKNYERNQMYIREIKHFLNCVKNRNRTINSLDDGIKTLGISLAMKKSAKYKKIIKLN